MTPQQKEVLRKETAERLRKPWADALDYLAKCRKGLHALDPKDPTNRQPRKWLFYSAKSWVLEARALKYAIEAASPDSQNARAVA